MNQKIVYPLAFVAAAAVMVLTSTPVFATEADEQIESSFKQTYVYKTYLRDDSVKAASKEGVVTLSGSVAEESHKTLANETAANLPGVVRVDNNLSTTAEVAAVNADLWIERKVKLALLFHRNVAVKTAVSVTDGVVTLKGEAANVAQKELSTEYAKDIEGVKEVKNEMTVAAIPAMTERTVGEKIDDASITAQVKTALLTHRSTSSLKTTVVTREGVVTLTGIVRNAAEKSLITKMVDDIQGVTSVKNLMTVNEIKSK